MPRITADRLKPAEMLAQLGGVSAFGGEPRSDEGHPKP